jgi:alpha-1,2-mannosyltransferase
MRASLVAYRMTELRVDENVTSVTTAAVAASFGSSLTRAVTWLFVIGAIGLFAYFGVRYFDETQHELRLLPWLSYDNRVDFNYFFSGANMAWHGEASDLYPVRGELTFYPGDPIFERSLTEYEKARIIARGNYYNPPALAYLQSPLTRLPYRYAFWLFSGLGVAAFAGSMFLGWRAGRGIPEMPLLFAGVLAFKPAHEAIMMGHVTPFFVLILTAGFLSLKAKQPVLTGLLFSLLALKPQWAILPALFLLWRREWRALAVMAVVSSLIFFVPFFITGFETFRNYYQFLRQAAAIDLKDAPHMFSWNGFLYKLEGYQPADPGGDPRLIYGLIALTAFVMLVVWWSRDFYLSVAATVIAMLLVSTHSVWYDWALLIVAALFLVLRPMSRGVRFELYVVLLALTLACSQSLDALLYPDRHLIGWTRQAFYSITPVAFATLVWIASVALRERLLKLPSLRGLRLRPPRPQPSGS